MNNRSGRQRRNIKPAIKDKVRKRDDYIDWEGIAEQKADLDNHRREMGWD